MPLPSPPLIHSLFYTHSLSLSLTYTLTLSLTQTHSPTPHTYTLTLTPPNTLSHTHTHTHTVHRGAVRRGHRRPRSKYGVKSAARIPNVRKQRWVRTDNTHAYAPTCVFSKTPYFFLWTVKENFVSLESLLVFCCSGYTLFSRFSSHHVSAPSSFLFEYYLPPIPSHFWTPIFALESSCWYLSDTELSPLLSSLFSSLFFPFPLADDDDEGAFSACQCLDTIGSVLDAVQERGDIMAQLEVIVIPMMMKWVPCYFKWCDLMWNRVM